MSLTKFVELYYMIDDLNYVEFTKSDIVEGFKARFR